MNILQIAVIRKKNLFVKNLTKIYFKPVVFMLLFHSYCTVSLITIFFLRFLFFEMSPCCPGCCWAPVLKQSSFLSYPSSWDYKCVPPCSACILFYINFGNFTLSASVQIDFCCHRLIECYYILVYIAS